MCLFELFDSCLQTATCDVKSFLGSLPLELDSLVFEWKRKKGTRFFFQLILLKYEIVRIPDLALFPLSSPS